MALPPLVWKETVKFLMIGGVSSSPLQAPIIRVKERMKSCLTIAYTRGGGG